MTNNPDTSPYPVARTPLGSSAPVVICFFGLAFGGLFLALGILLRRPDLLLPESTGPEVLVTRHLLMSAWIGSFFFGAAYWMGPSLAEAPLWSPALAWTHFVLHAVGMPWLLIALASGAAGDAAIGGLLLIAGVLLFAVNLMKTEGMHNRWSPANAALVCALFWLVIATGLPSLADFRREEGTDESVVAGIARTLHLHATLIGFMWLGVIACAIRFVTMFIPGTAREGNLTWLGLALVNLGLFALPVVAQGDHVAAAAMRAPDFVIVAGSLLLVADTLRLYLPGWRAAGTGVATTVVGVLMVTLELLRASVWGGFDPAMLPAVIAGLTLALVGLNMGLVPLLVWHLRCAAAGQSAESTLHQAKGLLVRRTMSAPLIAGSVGCAYFLAFGVTGHPAGIQLGSLLLLIAAAWSLVALHPALETFWHSRGSATRFDREPGRRA